MKKQYENSKYGRAKKRVDDIKGFYSHLTVYIIINIVLLVFKLDIFENGEFNIPSYHWSYFATPFFWGIGLLFHGLWVFGPSITSIKKWEERKIEQFMEKEREDEEQMRF